MYYIKENVHIISYKCVHNNDNITEKDDIVMYCITGNVNCKNITKKQQQKQDMFCIHGLFIDVNNITQCC